jgi:hypothetical protein
MATTGGNASVSDTDEKPTIKEHTMRVINILAIPVAWFVLVGQAGAQALSLDSPSQISVEIKRAEAAWRAWHAAANPKLEQTILTNPNALLDIDRDEQGAVQYLDARRKVFQKLSDALAVEIEALRTKAPTLSTGSAEKSERQKLGELLELQKRITAQDSNLPDPVKALLLREQRDRDVKTIDSLNQTVTRRLDILGHLADDERAASQQVDALTSTLELVRQHFRDMADSSEAEKTEWEDYFGGLRDIAVTSGVAVPVKGSGGDGLRPSAKNPGKVKSK